MEITAENKNFYYKHDIFSEKDFLVTQVTDLVSKLLANIIWLLKLFRNIKILLEQTDVIDNL